MDVTSLLNTAQRSSCCGESIEGSPHHPNHGRIDSPPNVLPRPCIEHSRENSNRFKWINTRSWDDGDLAISQIDKLDSQPRRAYAPVSPKHIHRAVFGANNRSRQSSTDSLFGVISPPPIHLARHSPTCGSARTCSTRMAYRDHRASYPEEMSTISKHKLSFSTSSFASAESPQSGCHSRLSSVASISGVSSSNIPISEMPSIDAKLLEAQSPHPSISITEQRPSPPLTSNSSAAIPSGSSRTNHLPDSPSDAVLNLTSLDKPFFGEVNLRPGLISQPKYHKRATSAPILASRSTTSASKTLKHRYPALSSTQEVMDKAMAKGLPTQAEEPEPTITTTYPDLDSEYRVPSHHTIKTGHTNAAVNRPHVREANLQTQDQVPDPASDVAPLTQLDPNMAREISLEALSATSTVPLEEEPRCMFVDDCQTGSQLRKAISHLFGRNKACTLRIPKQVWVYYCRKHYQRIRYRNAKTYPLNQMHLVKMQINRLQRWSDDNQRQGVGSYIKLWTLTLRKREQNRLNKEGGPADEGDDDSPETHNGSAAPEWIIQRLGTGYTTEQMLEVADRLHREIEDGTLCQVPEVEFLPDITESVAGNIAKLIRIRRQARTTATVGESKAPKRKISEATDSGNQSNFSLSNQHDTGESASSLRKRARLDSPQANYRQQPHQMSLPSIAMSPYADSHVLVPSPSLQSAVPRTLPTAPRMQIPYPGQYHGPDARAHEMHSNELQRPNTIDGFYSRDPQQYSAHYHLGIGSAQPPLFQRNGGHHNQQRLPSISAHLSGGSDLHNPNLAIPPYRHSGAFSNSPSVPRPPHLRSYSANIPTAQPNLEYPRPTDSSGAAQSGLACFDNRATSSSNHELTTYSYPREQWPESDRGYARGWSQSSAPQQQQNFYPSSTVYDQVTRPQMDGIQAPNYLGPAKRRTTSERAEHETHR
ncbi:hypothetical protein V8C37DRAFT_100659 [Trichoderma ceciliae]